MKRIVFIFLLLISLVAKSQFTNTSSSSSFNTLQTFLGGVKVNRGFINTLYADTTAANLQPIANYPGAQFFSNDTLNIRSTDGSKWLQFLPNGSSGSGISSISIASANGFAGSSSGGSTPTLTISTTINGLLKGNGTAISAAVAGTDYLTPTGSAALLTSFPTLNQNTTGSAAALTTPRNIQGVPFNGTADINPINGTGFVKATGTTLSYDNTTYLSTASEGLVASAGDVKFGGVIGSPGILSAERTINLNRKIFHWTNGIPAEAGGAYWQFTRRPYSPYQFISQDTVTTNNEGLSLARPLTGLFARRLLYFNPSTYRVNESYGHYLGQTFSFQDTLAVQTLGGDYMQSVIAEFRMKPRGTGRQVMATGHSTLLHTRRQEGVAALVANWYNDGDGTNRVYVRGTGVAFRPYLVSFTGTADTIENFVYVAPGNFVGGTGTRIRKSYVLAPDLGYGFVDSAFFLYDTARVARNMLAGKTVIGPGDSTTSQYQLKVYGVSQFTNVASYFSNIAANYSDRSLVDKRYVDSSIAAGGGATPGIDDVLAEGQALTTDREIDVNGNDFSIKSGGTNKFYIEVNPTSESGGFEFRNDIGLNQASVFANVNETESRASLFADSDDGNFTASIEVFSDNTQSINTYNAAAHIFNGNVGIGVAPSSLFQVSDGVNDWIYVNPTSSVSGLAAFYSSGGDNASAIHSNNINSEGSIAKIEASFNSTGAEINVSANGSGSGIDYEADGHRFTGKFGIGITPTQLFQVDGASNEYILVEEGDDRVKLQNTAGSQIDINNDNDFVFIRYIDNSTSIMLGQGSSTITYTASNHIFTGLANTSGQDRIVGQVSGTGLLGYITVGTGLSLSSGVLTATGSGLTVGTTTITSGTNTRILYNNSGVLGEYSVGTGVATWIGTPSSSNLAAAVTGETGSGALVFGTTPSFTTNISLLGSTSGSITLASDALSNVLEGTNLSGTGTVPFEFHILVRSDETLSNTTSDQALFSSTHDVITVQANTTYRFKLAGDLTHGATAHSIAVGFIPTTATVTNIAYNAMTWVSAVGAQSTVQTTSRYKVTSTSAITASAANATETFEVEGWITIGNTGGTITPSIKFSADPTGTILLKAGAEFHIYAIGNDTFDKNGPIN